jgi:hypothetical protein
MTQRLIQVLPGREIKVYDSFESSYLLKDLSKEDLRKNFAVELFEGFRKAKETSDEYLSSIDSKFIRPYYFHSGYLHSGSTLESESNIDFILSIDSHKKNVISVILQTELIGWQRNGWIKQNREELFSPMPAGNFNLMGIARANNKWILSTQEHHSIAFNPDFIYGIAKKYGSATSEFLKL